MSATWRFFFRPNFVKILLKPDIYRFSGVSESIGIVRLHVRPKLFIFYQFY